jgi:two-component system response regulator (stage 0 sporulation protein A)
MLNHKKGKKMTTKEIRYGAQMSHNIFIMKQLDNLGIKRKYLGYYFLLDILTGIINQTSRVQSFSRQIYPEIAKKYDKSACTIERNIRNLIDNCWNQELMQKLNVFLISKPTCCKFIYLVKNYISKQIV